MNDDLENKSDDELDELFAVEVVGSLEPAELRAGAPRAYCDTRTGAYRDCRWRECFTDFTRDANTVLPWLMKERTDHGSMVIVGPCASAAAHAIVWSVEIIDNTVNRHVVCISPAFARAAVVALIRAKRSFRP